MRIIDPEGACCSLAVDFPGCYEREDGAYVQRDLG